MLVTYSRPKITSALTGRRQRYHRLHLANVTVEYLAQFEQYFWKVINEWGNWGDLKENAFIYEFLLWVSNPSSPNIALSWFSVIGCASSRGASRGGSRARYACGRSRAPQRSSSEASGQSGRWSQRAHPPTHRPLPRHANSPGLRMEEVARWRTVDGDKHW